MDHVPKAASLTCTSDEGGTFQRRERQGLMENLLYAEAQMKQMQVIEEEEEDAGDDATEVAVQAAPAGRKQQEQTLPPRSKSKNDNLVVTSDALHSRGDSMSCEGSGESEESSESSASYASQDGQEEHQEDGSGTQEHTLKGLITRKMKEESMEESSGSSASQDGEEECQDGSGAQQTLKDLIAKKIKEGWR